MLLVVVGRAFDIGNLQGRHIQVTADKITVHYHVRKNSKLGLNKHKGHVFANYSALCPVRTIVNSMISLRIDYSAYLFHVRGDRNTPIKPASLVSSIKAIQRAAGIRSPLTITDFRSSTITTLAKKELGVKIIEGERINILCP